MKDGFICVSARSPQVEPAYVSHNIDVCVEEVQAAYTEDNARVIVLPELCVCGYTSGDLLLQEEMIRLCEAGIENFLQRTSSLDAICVIGAPVAHANAFYNCALVCHKGKILGIVPKTHIPTYAEFYEGRYFARGFEDVVYVSFAGKTNIPMGTRQIFCCDTMPNLKLACEICEDVWVACPPSSEHVLAGATVICNLSATPAQIGKSTYRRQLISQQSARCMCGYVYACAPWSESTQDLVFSAHNMVCENGHILAESHPFDVASATSQIDVDALAVERRATSTFSSNVVNENAYVYQHFSLELTPCMLTRTIDPHPFVPAQVDERKARCEEIFAIQAHGLAKRLMHTHTQSLVIGLSGGLDSTLALLVCVEACKIVGMDTSNIIAVTMPGFGTTQRTHGNASVLAETLATTLREISIVPAVRQHFADIGHDEHVHDVTYENSQARMRTQILMDIANQESGLVIGTGDLSEFALGWATYNGDHMSMYAVNVGVPKTLVRYLVQFVADGASYRDDMQAVRDVLLDILDTPVSPELLPAADDGTIAQKTEDLVGPYELHDFYLYYLLRKKFAPQKIYRMACIAFQGMYEPEVIRKWEKVFYRRFFSQQFKRSCMCDGPKVGSVALSPRGDWRMPSDARVQDWISSL